MAEGSGLKQLVADEVSEQLDVADLIDGGSLEDGIDGGEIGASVGRQFGERVGYELGAAIGLKIHETISEGVEQEKDLGEIRSDLATAVRDAFGETVEELEVTDSLGLTEEEAEDEAGGPESEGEEAEDEGETDEEAADGAENAEADEPSAEDLEGLRRETLEEFLSIMSYSDLQSVAKDVGVKANLSREEMTDRIVETVTESDDELAAAADEEGS